MRLVISLNADRIKLTRESTAMQARYLYSELAHTIDAYRRCRETGNNGWKDRHADWIEHMEKNLLPSGSGFDCGTKLVLDECHAERLVFETSYHHMHESGMYDGWTEHRVIVTPSFSGGFKLRITGRNRNDIKEYMYEVFSTALCADSTLEWYQYHFDGVPTWQWHQDTQTGKTSYSVHTDVDVHSFTSMDEVRRFIVSWCEDNRTTARMQAKGGN